MLWKGYWGGSFVWGSRVGLFLRLHLRFGGLGVFSRVFCPFVYGSVGRERCSLFSFAVFSVICPCRCFQSCGPNLRDSSFWGGGCTSSIPSPPPPFLSLSLCLSVSLSFCLYLCLSVSLSVSLCVSFCLSLCLFLSVSVSVSLSACLSVSFCLFVCLSVCLSLSSCPGTALCG